MTKTTRLTRDDFAASVASLPLDSLVRMVAASNDAVGGLQAMAQEIGGREGAKIRSLAERIRRGESMDQEGKQLSLLQAVAGDERSMAGHVPRWVLLRDQRTQTRRSLRRIVWFALGYLTAATIVGLGIQTVCTKLVDELGISSFGFFYNSVQSQPVEIAITVRYGYQILLLSLLVLIVLWAVRGMERLGSSSLGSWLAQPVERFWKRVPFVGSTYSAIDLAQMSESIYQSLSASWTYPQAFRTAALETRSSVLRQWLTNSADRLERGEKLEAVLGTCALQANWLNAMSQLLAVPMSSESLSEQWLVVSNRFHHLMLARARRTMFAVAPSCMLIATVLLVFGWGVAMRALLQLVVVLS
jgi:hypothetical protein